MSLRPIESTDINLLNQLGFSDFPSPLTNGQWQMGNDNVAYLTLKLPAGSKRMSVSGLKKEDEKKLEIRSKSLSRRNVFKILSRLEEDLNVRGSGLKCELVELPISLGYGGKAGLSIFNFRVFQIDPENVMKPSKAVKVVAEQLENEIKQLRQNSKIIIS